jgi:hypothetical protein
LIFLISSSTLGKTWTHEHPSVASLKLQKKRKDIKTTYIGAKPDGNLWALVTTKDGQLDEYRASKGSVRKNIPNTKDMNSLILQRSLEGYQDASNTLTRQQEFSTFKGSKRRAKSRRRRKTKGGSSSSKKKRPSKCEHSIEKSHFFYCYMTQSMRDVGFGSIASSMSSSLSMRFQKSIFCTVESLILKAMVSDDTPVNSFITDPEAVRGTQVRIHITKPQEPEIQIGLTGTWHPPGHGDDQGVHYSSRPDFATVDSRFVGPEGSILDFYIPYRDRDNFRKKEFLVLKIGKKTHRIELSHDAMGEKLNIEGMFCTVSYMSNKDAKYFTFIKGLGDFMVELGQMTSFIDTVCEDSRAGITQLQRSLAVPRNPNAVHSKTSAITSIYKTIFENITKEVKFEQFKDKFSKQIGYLLLVNKLNEEAVKRLEGRTRKFTPKDWNELGQGRFIFWSIGALGSEFYGKTLADQLSSDISKSIHKKDKTSYKTLESSKLFPMRRASQSDDDMYDDCIAASVVVAMIAAIRIHEKKDDKIILVHGIHDNVRQQGRRRTSMRKKVKLELSEIRRRLSLKKLKTFLEKFNPKSPKQSFIRSKTAMNAQL